MTWGSHNSFADAYAAASSFIRQVEPIKAEMANTLSAEVPGEVLERFWTKARANANDLANIRTLVEGVVDYAKTQHPPGYDIEALWLAAEAAYAGIADEIEKVLLATDGTVKRTRIVNKTVERVAFTPAQTVAIKTAIESLPDIRAGR